MLTENNPAVSQHKHGQTLNWTYIVHLPTPLQAPAGSRDIPGLNSNPDPGILENIIPGFLGIYHIKQNHDFKDFYWFLNLIFPKNPGIKI